MNDLRTEKCANCSYLHYCIGYELYKKECMLDEEKEKQEDNKQ